MGKHSRPGPPNQPSRASPPTIHSPRTTSGAARRWTSAAGIARSTAAVHTAIERQAQALRDRREPEEAFGDGQAALEELRAKANRPTSPNGARARALQRLAAERSGRVFAASAVRRTA